MMGLGKPKLFTKFEVATSAAAEILKGEAQNFGELPVAEGHTHFSF